MGVLAAVCALAGAGLAAGLDVDGFLAGLPAAGTTPLTARPAALITAENSDDTGIERTGDGWAWVLGLAFGEAFEATGAPSGAGRVAIGTISAASASMVAASATAREVGFGATGSEKTVLTGGAGSTTAGATAANATGSGAGETIIAGASTKLSVGAGSIDTDTETSADANSGAGSEGAGKGTSN